MLKMKQIKIFLVYSISCIDCVCGVLDVSVSVCNTLNQTVKSLGIILPTYQLNLKYCCKWGVFMDAYKCNKPTY